MNIYKRQRFPPDIISDAVWLYHRFNLSHRDIEELLAERRISVSHESIRLWCIKCGPVFARRLRRKHRGFGDTFYVDEGFVKIRGKQHYLWRAVDQDGDGVDVFLQDRRDGRAAKRFFRRLIRRHGGEPTGRSNRTRQRGLESAVLGASNPQSRRNVSWACIRQYTTCSIWVVIWSEPAIIGI